MNIEKTVENLKKNNMTPYVVKDKNKAAKKVLSLLSENETVAVGGSMTLFECGIIELLRSGKYNFLDRYKEGLSREEVMKLYRESFFADTYISSSNAVTENGELYNVDGNSNRVAALLFGPKSVIIVVGKQKIVENLDEAVRRVKKVAAPKNSKRLSCSTYCEKKGVCVSEAYSASDMTEGCASEDRICANYTVMAQQRIKDRIKVIIIDEEAGY